MPTLARIYRENLTLATDLYQLTMAYGYWRTGTHLKESVFNLFFRRTPFQGGYAVACGLQYVLDLLESFHFGEDDLAYLGTLQGNDGRPLFESGFLEYLGGLKLECDVDGIPEGTLVFPNQPLLRVRGPIIQAQILETALLNIINFQTLIATKASRVTEAAGGEPVLEFGLRRAQGMDGALAASWASYVGGCSATSNVLAGKIFGIPVKGTHAHSWVMSFPEEEEAFERYAEAMPNNCVFLVDTYDTLEGVRKAIRVGKKLKEQGYRMVGVRLDSGDLAGLSRQARTLLDEAGFHDAAIVASNDLNEHLIEQLRAEGACINVWGVGTHLATSYNQAALGGVYKLAAIRDLQEGADWEHKVKLSEQEIKVSTPGIQQVRRYSKEGKYLIDMIYEEGLGVGDSPELKDSVTGEKVSPMEWATEWKDLLIPVFRAGKKVYHPPKPAEVREFALKERACLPANMRKLADPSRYPVGLETRLHELRSELIARARGGGLKESGTINP